LPQLYTDGYIPLESFRELEKNYKTLPLNLQITDGIIDGMKCHWKIFRGSQKISVLIIVGITN